MTQDDKAIGRRVTLEEVARMAGVSRGTGSRLPLAAAGANAAPVCRSPTGLERTPIASGMGSIMPFPRLDGGPRTFSSKEWLLTGARSPGFGGAVAVVPGRTSRVPSTCPRRHMQPPTNP